MPPKRKIKDATKQKDIMVKKPKTSKKVTKSEKKNLALADELNMESKNADFISSYLKDKSWCSVIGEEFKKEYFLKIEKVIQALNEKKVDVYPPKAEIFHAFNLTPFDKAHGLSFSVSKGIKTPPSLKNIYKELEKDIKGFVTPDHGCLEKWAMQGVLLLNAALTVEAGEANSHGKKKFGWQKFTDTVIQKISEESSGVVFILWGNFAHQKAALVDTSKHTVVKTAHPSPLSFNKFSGCKCFSETNKALKKYGKSEIDWTL